MQASMPRPCVWVAVRTFPAGLQWTCRKSGVVPRTLLVIEVRALFLVMHVAAVTLNSLSAETIGDAYHLTSSIGLSTNPLASS
jgi:hypothetical protein